MSIFCVVLEIDILTTILSSSRGPGAFFATLLASNWAARRPLLGFEEEVPRA
jgi:hypothetical protein